MSAVIELDRQHQEPEMSTRPESEGAFEFYTIHGPASAAGAKCTYQLDVPYEPLDDNVNVIIYGFAGSDAAYRGLAKALTTEQGLPTLSLQLSRFQHPRAALSRKHLMQPTALTSKLVHAAIGKLPTHDMPEKVNLFGHSMGGWIGTELAVHKPHLVNTLTLVGSAGLTEHNILTLGPRFPRLVGQIALDLVKERPNALSLRNLYDSGRHIASNPMLTLGEMITVANCNIRDRLEGGIVPNIVVLHPERDELFDADAVRGQVDGLVDCHFTMPGLGHGAPITHPSETAAHYAAALRTL